MAEKGLFIEALPRDGLVTFLALVKDKALRPKRTGGWYLYLLLSDRTAEIEAKAWDHPQETAALVERDDIVKVRGTVELYNDHPQLIVQRIRRCEAGEFQEADFCPTSARDPEEMFRELQGFVDSLGNSHVRALLQSVLNDPAFVPAFKVVPAAIKLHHAYRCGLLEHSLSLCELADALVRKYPRLNRDWLIAGAVLHDLGKVEELGTSRRLGYTTRGQLVGHVALGLEILEKHVSRLPGFPVEVKNMLQHLIVSHHGEIEKGALRPPMFPEALALSIADLLDARLEQAWRLIDQGPTGEEWTVYVPSLERQLYRWCPLAEEELDACPPTNGGGDSGVSHQAPKQTSLRPWQTMDISEPRAPRAGLPMRGAWLRTGRHLPLAAYGRRKLAAFPNVLTATSRSDCPAAVTNAIALASATLRFSSRRAYGFPALFRYEWNKSLSS